jgi:hypothetical protein
VETQDRKGEDEKKRRRTVRWWRRETKRTMKGETKKRICKGE